MMNFIVLVAAIVVGILMASFIAFALMFNGVVLKWYTKKCMKMMEEIMEEL